MPNQNNNPTQESTLPTADHQSPCLCGSGDTYSDCCLPLHLGIRPAVTAEALMRSRYSAYALHNADYLNRTHHASTLDEDLKASLKGSFDHCQWTGLSITGRKGGGPKDNEGVVRFEAAFTQEGKRYVLKETSRFIREGDRWFYLDGTGGIEPLKVTQPGRNDPCWCGSGKKFKKCHGG